MSSAINLSVIIPAYNEEKRIGPTLWKIAAFLSRQSYKSEIIVVDDASFDRTRAVVEDFPTDKVPVRLLTNNKNIGKGAAVRRGMQQAKGAHRLFSDADLSTPIEEVEGFLKLSPPYEVVIGSRRVKGSNVAKRQPALREASGRIFSLLVRLFTVRGFIDTQCGFKMFTAKAADEVFKRQTINRFGFDVELIYIAKKLGFKIKEAPVTWVDSPDTRVRLLRDAPKMFLDLLTIPLNNLRHKYK